MKDNDLKSEFEGKLRNIISKTRKIAIDKATLKIYCSILQSLLRRYFSNYECNDIVRTIREISRNGNLEQFNILIDMLGELYLPSYEKETQKPYKEKRI